MADDDDGMFYVDPNNWPAVVAFCQCSTQWRYGAMGGVIGLDYPGVKTVLDLTVKRQERGAIFEAIQIMERAALVVLNERAQEKNG